jgi:hypothetical protein
LTCIKDEMTWLGCYRELGHNNLNETTGTVSAVAHWCLPACLAMVDEYSISKLLLDASMNHLQT